MLSVRTSVVRWNPWSFGSLERVFSCRSIDLPVGRERIPLQVRERVRVHMLLSLVAHVVGYKMMVGAHNTVCVRRMWEVLLHFTMYGK